MFHRHGFSHQVPARRALERDEEKVTGWAKDTWPQVETLRRRSGLDRLRGRGRLLDDAAYSQDLVPARAHAGGPVRGRSQRRFSIAALACYKTGERSRLIFRPNGTPTTRAKDDAASPGPTIAIC
jgi:hypothetical protein